ncbi:MAG: extracellular solute-binding protein [Gammaproteobacteria bacterium]
MKLTSPNIGGWHFAGLRTFTLLVLSALTACSPSSEENTSESSTSVAVDQVEKLVVYSSRNEQLIKPLFETYTAQTGIEIEFITDKEGPLIQRLKAEGAATPADLLLTVDAGNLWFAQQQNLLQPVQSSVLDGAVPDHLRDPDGHWYALSVRARTIVYHPERVEETKLSTYEALADDEWKGRLCLRTSKKVYNQSLVAMMIATKGEAATEAVVRGWIDNLAAPVFSSDTKLIEAIAAGQCDVGIVNTYYLGRLVAKDPGYPVKLFFANQATEGVHVNVSGIGVTAESKRVPQAIHLIEWLATGEAQEQFAGVNIEFPLLPSTKVADLVAQWGTFKPQLINVSRAGELQTAAVKLMDRAGYN